MAKDLARYKFSALAQRVFASVLVVVGGFATAVWLWPDGLADRPISSIGFGAVVYITGAAIAVFVSIVVLTGIWSE